jgi:hypothetical protein
MSDVDISTAAPADSGAAAPDVSSITTDAAPSATEAPSGPSTTETGAPEADAFAGLDVEKIFGLPKENGQSTEVAPDVKATDPPVSRQDDQPVETHSGDAAVTAEPAQTDKNAQDDSGFKPNEKLNWDDDKVPFRNEYNVLKQAYTELLGNSMEGQFINSPADFVQNLKEKSPTSYNQVGAMLATESATSHPEQWVDFLLQEPQNADLIAQKITGRDDMTVDRLKAELEVLIDDDDPDVKAVMERQKTEAESKAQTKAPETPEQKRIRELLEKEDQREAAEFRSQVFGPVENAVDQLISQAGLEIKDGALDGKSLKDLDPETKFKALVNDMIPVYIGQRANTDPQLKNMQARLQDFIDAKDIKSALNMQHAIKIAVTNIAGEFLEIITAQRAKARTADDLPPSGDNPPPIVRGAGAGASLNGSKGLKDPVSDDEWAMTESDLVRRR